MEDTQKSKVRIVKFRIPKRCTCPSCGMKQPFKKEKEHHKTVKDIDTNKPTLFKVRMVYAKCSNPGCKRHSFPLPTPGFEKYKRITKRLKQEAIASLIQDNSTLSRTAERFDRSLNISASKSTIDRWKHEEADRYSFKEIIARLGFSGILSIDEYKPKRSRTYDLIASDAIRDRILYLENIPRFYSAKAIGSVSRGRIEAFLVTLRNMGIVPWAIIFDLATVFPKQARKVYPNIIIQFDYFHVMQEIYRHLKNALLKFRKDLMDLGLEDERREIWEHKWRLLKDMDKWTSTEQLVMEDMISYYQDTIVENVLIFKEQVRDIFNNSKDQKEAYAKRDALAEETYWQDSYHLSKIVKFLSGWKFEYMTTYLKYLQVPRCGNSESCIRIFRLMEKVRYGMTAKGRQDHLKLYQISKYLNEKFV